MKKNDKFTPADLESAGKALYGSEWQSKLAHALAIDPRRVRFWMSGRGKPKTSLMLDVIALLEDNQKAILVVKNHLRAKYTKEMNMSSVFSITDEKGYDGSGLAMAATKDNYAVKIIYLRDLIEDYDDSRESRLTWLTYAKHEEVKKAAQEITKFGRFAVGICSSWEFIEF